MKKQPFFSTLVMGVLASFTSANTFYIKSDGTGDYPTIQEAINASVDGDNIVLSDGTYTGLGNYNIDFQGKDITLKSENGPDYCIIDCQQISRAFNFKKGEGRNASISGLQVINGKAFGSLSTYSERGGAIFISQSSPTVENCVFQNNIASNCGGAVWIDQGNPLFRDCIFETNYIHGGSSGGAIQCVFNSTLSIINCLFIDNYVVPPSTGGGAIFIGGRRTNLQRLPSEIIAKNCIFIDNHATTGGAIVNYGYANLSNCLFTNNQAIDYGWGNPINIGGAFANYGKSIVRNCTFYNNNAEYAGGAISCYGYSLNTDLECEAIIVNNIFWNNGLNELYIDDSLVDVKYCCIQDGFTDHGNINCSPMFKDPNSNDFTLLPHSPCINSGDPNYKPESRETDLAGNTRVMGKFIDMGAYEFSQNAPPIAQAGPDQVIFAGMDGLAKVQLDGTASYDPDGDVLEYFWYNDANDLIAAGAEPNVILPIGEHVITLIVNDGVVDSEPNDVLITVIGPMEAQMMFVPQVLNPKSCGRYVMAIITLPKGVMIEDLDENQPWRLLPGDIEALFSRTATLHRRQIVYAVFDRDELIDALDVQEQKCRIRRFWHIPWLTGTLAEITVYGKLDTGQVLFGTDTIRLIRPFKPKPKPHPLPNHNVKSSQTGTGVRRR